MATNDGFKRTPTGLVLAAAPQTITDTWADMGGEIETAGYKNMGMWYSLDINDSQNVRFRFLAKQLPGAAGEYSFPIKTVSATKIDLEFEYFEVVNDADQKVVFSIDLGNLIPIVQVQVMAGTAGATPGKILTAEYCLGN